jgi:hypothetical protein
VGTTARAEKIHSTVLFPAIVFLLVAQPVFASLSAAATELLAAALGVALVAGIWSLDRGGVWFRVALGLGLVVLAALVAHVAYPERNLVEPVMAALAALGVICVVLGIRWLFASIAITVQSLLAALSVYLLIGITFGLIHSCLFVHDPSWYKGVDLGVRSAELAELFYFSLGTLTTTAYGDILPAHPLSRLLCNIEAVVGQMYVAVLVAVLVSGYAAGRTGGASGDAPPS